MQIIATRFEEVKTTWIESTICDICKKKYIGSSWEAKMYNVLETEISFRYGTSYPEGGSGTKIEFDICPECFKNKLIPLLKTEFGATPRETEWDY